MSCARHAQRIVVASCMEHRGVRSEVEILGHLLSLRLAKQLHLVSVLFVLERQRLLNRVEFHHACQHCSILLHRALCARQLRD